MQMIRAARRANSRSTCRNEPRRKGSSLCFVLTSVDPAAIEASAAVDVGVDEVRVDDVGPLPPQEPGHAHEERGSRSRGARRRS